MHGAGQMPGWRLLYVLDRHPSLPFSHTGLEKSYGRSSLARHGALIIVSLGRQERKAAHGRKGAARGSPEWPRFPPATAAAKPSRGRPPRRQEHLTTAGREMKFVVSRKEVRTLVVASENQHPLLPSY